MTGVSARPRPGTGRKTSCWCSWAVPPLMRAADQVGVARLELARARAPAGPGPGDRSPARAARSGPASGRRTARGRRRPRRPRMPLVARVARRRAAARACRPTATRCPAGDRVGSVVVIWPASRNGAAGIVPRPRPARAPRSSARPSRRRARCPGACAGLARPRAPGPSSAQSTLTVPGSSWKRRIARAASGGAGRSARRRPPYRCGAATSATTARRAAQPLAVAGAYAGRAAVAHVDPVDLGSPQRISPPSDAEPPGQRPGQLAGAALGHREADGLAEHASSAAPSARSRARRAGCRRARRCRPAAAAGAVAAEPCSGRGRRPG